MSVTPDLQTITSRMESDVNHYIPGAELRPKLSVLGILTKVFAAAIHALYQFAQHLLRNTLPSLCHDDWLPAWAYVLRTPRKDGESLEDWRARLVLAFANRAKIGDADDYVEWALAAHPAIKYAWVYGNTPNLGDITILVATDDENPIPSAEILVNANDALNRLRNVGCHIMLLSTAALSIPVIVARIPVSERGAVQAALVAHFRTLRNGGQTLYVADLHAAIRSVYSGIYSLSAPTVDITAGERELLMLGTLTWL